MTQRLLLRGRGRSVSNQRAPVTPGDFKIKCHIRTEARYTKLETNSTRLLIETQKKVLFERLFIEKSYLSSGRTG